MKQAHFCFALIQLLDQLIPRVIESIAHSMFKGSIFEIHNLEENFELGFLLKLVRLIFESVIGYSN